MAFGAKSWKTNENIENSGFHQFFIFFIFFCSAPLPWWADQASPAARQPARQAASWPGHLASQPGRQLSSQPSGQPATHSLRIA